MLTLVSRLLSLARARPGTLLPDLGSGVGNVVLQAALQTGCSSFGVELMENRGGGGRVACADDNARADVGRDHGRRRARTREHAREPAHERSHGAHRGRACECQGFEGALVISLGPFVAGRAT